MELTLQDPSEKSETWSLAFFVGMADELSSPCRSLLAWREETCPLRGREVSRALDYACCQFDDKYQALLARLDSCTSLSPEEKVNLHFHTRGLVRFAHYYTDCIVCCYTIFFDWIHMYYVLLQTVRRCLA